MREGAEGSARDGRHSIVLDGTLAPACPAAGARCGYSLNGSCPLRRRISRCAPLAQESATPLDGFLVVWGTLAEAIG